MPLSRTQQERDFTLLVGAEKYRELCEAGAGIAGGRLDGQRHILDFHVNRVWVLDQPANTVAGKGG